MKIVKKIIPSLLAATMLVSLSACGGGDEDITVNVTVNNTTSGTTYVPAPTAATGVFTDAPIAGLAYTCGTSSGTTNDSGSFNFYTGNSCSFSFGTAALTIASSKLSSTSPKITPFDITEFSDDPLKAVRFMQLIQSLDKADDGKIDLASLTDKNVDLNAAVSSDTGLQNAFNSLSSSFTDRENQLITAAEALTHFQTQNSSLISKIPADLEVVGWENPNIAGVANPMAPKPHPIRTETQITAATVLPAEITSNMTLTSETLYKIDGRTKVKNGATVTIEPGTVVFGESSDDILIFTKGTKLQAAGTAADPIIFTSKTALLNPADADVRQWGGLTLLGNAPTNQPDPHYEIDETDEDFAYGGSVANDNSGTLKNLYILNSGGTFGQEQEVNGLSFCGVGSGTTVQDIYVENSSDDCIEVWGGTVNITNATMVNCNDDSFDLDQGWSGTATNIVVQQTNTAAAGFEISSGGSTPMTSGKIVNFTINKASGSNEGGIYIKDDTTAVKYINGVVTTYNTDPALFVKKVMTQAQKDATKFADVLLNSTQKFGGSGATDIETIHIANDASYE